MVAPLPQPKKPRQEARPIGIRRPATLPTGKRAFSARPERRGGAGTPPDGFVGASTSGSEWIVYVAFAKVLNDPPDPRRPPFFGGASWGYQIPIGGAFVRQLGSAVVDFVYYAPHERVFVRLQTLRFHEGLGPAVQGNDVLQRALLSEQGRVVDIYESQFVFADPSEPDPLDSNLVLQAACVAVKNALGLIETVSPIAAGTSQARG